MRLPRIARRLTRWVTGADCTCGHRSAPDHMHHWSCPHILLPRWHRR